MSAEPIELSWTEAVLGLIRHWNARRISIDDGIQVVVAATGQEGFPVEPADR